MKNVNFDAVIDRRNTNSLKHDFAKENNLPEDVLPMWVADMDFKAPPCVLEALQKSVDHGIFGYSDTNQEMEELTALMATIIRRRQELGWSQRELAKRCGMPQSSIARMETGINFPRVDTLARVLRELGMTLVVQPAN